MNKLIWIVKSVLTQHSDANLLSEEAKQRIAEDINKLYFDRNVNTQKNIDEIIKTDKEIKE